MPLNLIESERPSWSGFKWLFPEPEPAFSSRVTFTFCFFFPRTSGGVPANIEASPSLFVSRSLRRVNGRRPPVCTFGLFSEPEADDLRCNVLALRTDNFSVGGAGVFRGSLRSIEVTDTADSSSDLMYTMLERREPVV